jgi:hypothetical protein
MAQLRVLRDIAIFLCISLVTLEGVDYISPLYYQAVVRLSSTPGWSTPRFVAVWCLELAAWAAAAIAVALVLRSRRWYWWALGLGSFGTFVHWPLAIFAVGSHDVTVEDKAFMYGHSLLPLVGAALGTATWLIVHNALRRPPNVQVER